MFKGSIVRGKGLYLGASFGQSILEPNVKPVGGKVDDNKGTAFKLNAGYRINKRFAVEAFYADLGKAAVMLSAKKVI